MVGLDFSGLAVDAARVLAGELGLADRARFVQADVYDTLQVIPGLHSFDMVFVTWGAITWLPDIERWTQIVAAMLRPGGSLYLADGHPVAYVFDDATRSSDGMPGFFAPYFSRQPVVTEDPNDYVDPEAQLANASIYNWIHPLGDLVTSLIASGLTLNWLHEHDAVTWRMFEALVMDGSGLYRWRDRPWLPLAFSLAATRR